MQSITYLLKTPHLYSEGSANEDVNVVLFFDPPVSITCMYLGFDLLILFQPFFVIVFMPHFLITCTVLIKNVIIILVMEVVNSVA